jgi:trehalose 6-phosphate phosphatase
METTVPATEAAAGAALSVLASRPSALITDVDGTISAIVPRPQDAVVEEGVRRSLRSLRRQLDLVAVVTARQESVARAMVGVPELTYVGNYALDAGVAVDVSPLEPVLSAVRPFLDSFPCLTLERKGIAFALHYRNCSQEGVRESLLEVLGPAAEQAGARLQEGKQVIEVLPPNLPHKGTAIARLLRKRKIHGVVYLGDDLGDVPVFQEIARRRAIESLPGLSIAVTDAETPAAVSEAADLQVTGVAGVQDLLESLSLALSEEGEANA